MHLFLHLLPALGPLLLIAGVVQLVVVRSIRSKRVKVTGEILHWEHSGGVGSGYNSSNPVVGFTTREGQPIAGKKNWSFDTGIYREKPVPVWYDPDDPERFSTETTFLAKPGVLLIGLSIPVIIVTALVLGVL